MVLVVWVCVCHNRLITFFIVLGMRCTGVLTCSPLCSSSCSCSLLQYCLTTPPPKKKKNETACYSSSRALRLPAYDESVSEASLSSESSEPESESSLELWWLTPRGATIRPSVTFGTKWQWTERRSCALEIWPLTNTIYCLCKYMDGKVPIWSPLTQLVGTVSVCW